MILRGLLLYREGKRLSSVLLALPLLFGELLLRLCAVLREARLQALQARYNRIDRRFGHLRYLKGIASDRDNDREVRNALGQTLAV